MYTTEEIKQKFDKAVKDRDDCKFRKVELETQLHLAKDEIEKSMARLKEEFGIESLEDAETEIKSLGEKIDKELQECEDFLSKFED